MPNGDSAAMESQHSLPPCMENCTSVYFQPTVSIANIHESFLLQAGRRIKGKIIGPFNATREAVARNRDWIVYRIRDMIKSYKDANDTLVNLHLAPVDGIFWTTFERLKENPHCFGNVFEKFKNFIEACQINLSVKEIYEQLIDKSDFMEAILSAKDLPIVKAAMEPDLLDWALDFIHVMNRICGQGRLMDQNEFHRSHVGTGVQYDNFNDFILRYEKKEITRNDWADLMRKPKNIGFPVRFVSPFL